jgi:hypothetical protein
LVRLCRDVKDYRGITKIGLAVRHSTAKPGVRSRAKPGTPTGRNRAKSGTPTCLRNRGHPRVFEIGDTHVSLLAKSGTPTCLCRRRARIRGNRGHPRLFRETADTHVSLSMARTKSRGPPTPAPHTPQLQQGMCTVRFSAEALAWRRNEPPRIWWRLQLLRGWSHEQIKQVFA